MHFKLCARYKIVILETSSSYLTTNNRISAKYKNKKSIEKMLKASQTIRMSLRRKKKHHKNRQHKKLDRIININDGKKFFLSFAVQHMQVLVSIIVECARFTKMMWCCGEKIKKRKTWKKHTYTSKSSANNKNNMQFQFYPFLFSAYFIIAVLFFVFLFPILFTHLFCVLWVVICSVSFISTFFARCYSIFRIVFCNSWIATHHRSRCLRAHCAYAVFQ